MSLTIVIRRRDGDRRVTLDQLPLSVGGAASELSISGLSAEGPAAHLGVADDEPFLQPVPGVAAIRCNGTPITVSTWLHHGDRVEIGAADIAVSRDGHELVLTVTESVPTATAPEPSVRLTDAGVHGVIDPIPFTPSTGGSRRARRWQPHPVSIAAAVVVSIAVAVLWYVLTSAVVTVDITPAPERLELSGGLIRPSVAGSYLLRPGRYRIVAEHSDYRRLERELTVSGRVNQVFRFSLIPRPGTLSVDTEPLTGAAVEVNGRLVGTTPLGGVELELGSHEVVLRADRHQVHATTVTVERPGEEQHLSVELVPAWAAVTVRSQPSGADVIVDGSSMGITPLTTDLGAGRHRLELRLAGFKPHASTLEVVANEPRTLGVIRLVPDDGILDLESDPAGATVTVDGGFIGQSPLRLALAPGTDHEIKVAKTGHRTQALTVRLEAGARTSRSVRLEPIYGEVEILSTPSGAQVVIDGTAVGLTATTVTLPAVSHTVELRKAGYEPFTATVVPEEGLLETLHATLQPVDDSPASTDPSSLTTSQGATLVRVPAGALVMGASRREPGRRANESLREVEITKPFYLAIHEVTNDQFRQFSPEHSSGQTGGVSLGGGDHPVVAVTWDDAVRFCNWLSEQEGLPPVYVERNGTWTARQPFPDGYRLPTEAEWALAARGAGDAPRKYSWGSDLPLPEGAGNYGDTTAGRILDETLPEYRDGHVATAPVGSFEANPIGLFDLGGNVAEWVHDAYTMYPPSSGDAIRDPTGPAEGEYHVIRGASWMDGRLTRLRLSHRDYGKDAASDVGFRVARNAH